MYMMSAAWASLALVLSALAAAWTWWAWQHQGVRGALRGGALVLLPLALWLTGTLRLAGAIVDWVASWATGLIFSPSVWVGTALLVASVVLWGIAGRVGPRTPRPPGRGVERRSERAVAAPVRRGRPAAQDDDLADIEALLRERGIS